MAKYERVVYSDTMKIFVDKYNANLDLIESFSTVVPKSRINITPENGIITVPNGYHRGVNDMQVYMNGLLLEAPSDYIESTDTTITIRREYSNEDRITVIYTPLSVAPSYGKQPEVFGGGIVDNTQSYSTNEALSANQGKVINDRLTSNVAILTSEILALQATDKQIQDMMTNLEDTFESLIINAGESNAEVVEARNSTITGNHHTLDERLEFSDKALQSINETAVRMGEPIEGVESIPSTDIMSELQALREEVASLRETCVLSYPHSYGIADVPDSDINAELLRMQTIYEQTVFPQEVNVEVPHNQYQQFTLRDFNGTRLLVSSSTSLVLDSSGETQFDLNRYYNSKIVEIINRLEEIVVRLNALEGES